MKRLERTPSESAVLATHLILPEDTNALGTIFGGKLMAWMDLAAATCAIRHSQLTCVTVSVDEFHFLAPVNLGDILNIKAIMTFTHVSSMEILVTAERESPETGEKVLTCSAYFSFVARDRKTGEKVTVPKLSPVSKEEKNNFNAGLKRREHRLKVAATKVATIRD